jgi:hypothetical protein
MPTISVTNLTARAFPLPGGFYTSLVLPGTTVTFSVKDSDEFLGIPAVATMIAAGAIGVVPSTADASIRPVPVYTTITLPATTTYPTGTLVWDSTRMTTVADISDIWRPHTVVIAGTAAQLGALTNVPTNALAFCSDIGTGTLVRYTGAAWVACNLSLPITSQAGLPANPHVDGQLTYDETLQALFVCTTAGSPGTWDSVFVAPTGTTGAPPAEAATVTGGVYFDTSTSHLAFRVGTAWLHLPVVNYATAAAVEAIRTADAVVTTGQFGWASDLNRIAVYNAVGAPLGPWITDTTVGMYVPGAPHVYNGAIIHDPTGFINTMLNQGTLRVYSTAAVAWMPNSIVAPTYANVGAFPAVGDVPEGSLAIDASAVGVPGTVLYAKIGAAWVAAL